MLASQLAGYFFLTPFSSSEDGVGAGSLSRSCGSEAGSECGVRSTLYAVDSGLMHFLVLRLTEACDPEQVSRSLEVLTAHRSFSRKYIVLVLQDVTARGRRVLFLAECVVFSFVTTSKTWVYSTEWGCD